MKPWTEADSRDLDRAIRAGRQAEQTERLGRARGRAVNQQGMTTVAYDGVPRGYLTDDDLRRRKKVSRAMQVRAERDANKDARATYKANRAKRRSRVRWPRPKQQPNGRWRAVITVSGTRYQQTFDTEAQAQAWLDQMIKENS